MLLTIIDGTQVLEERECPLVALQDGRPAGIWRGLAFPLLPNGRAIDVSQEGFSPAMRRPAGGPAGSLAAGFSIEAADDEAYVLIPGSGLEVAQAAKSLQRAGLDVLRTGRHYGDRGGDVAADWFVKIVRPNGISDLQAIVAQALGVSKSGEQVGFDRTSLLKADLLSARAREASAREEIARLRLALRDEASASAHEIEALRADLEQESAARRQAEAEAEAEARQPDPSPRPAPRPMERARRIIRDEIRAVAEALLPNLVFLKASLDVLVIEFSDRRSVYRVLRQLHVAEHGRPREGKWKPLANAGGDWIESHVSNGDDDSGRVYARRDASTRTWAVLLSNKGQQTRDIAWLRAQD